MPTLTFDLDTDTAERLKVVAQRQGQIPATFAQYTVRRALEGEIFKNSEQSNPPTHTIQKRLSLLLDNAFVLIGSIGIGILIGWLARGSFG